MGIIRKLNKEFPMYFYTIYTTHIQSVLILNNSILRSMHYL